MSLDFGHGKRREIQVHGQMGKGNRKKKLSNTLVWSNNNHTYLDTVFDFTGNTE